MRIGWENYKSDGENVEDGNESNCFNFRKYLIGADCPNPSNGNMVCPYF